MMLIDLIKTHALADAQAANWTAVAATLNAQTVEVRNPKSWTMADLITLLGAESAAVVGGTIQDAGVTNPIFAGAWLALNITGLQLHTDERQAMITALAEGAGWPSELKAAALAAGLTYTSLAGEAVTAEECESAWALDLKGIALATVTEAASEAAREEYRKAESTPASIIAAAVAVLES
jgi:hypothetical protein